LTGKPTIERLARVVGKRLGRPVTEATIRHDIRDLRLLLRTVLRAAQEGRIIKRVEWESAERE